ncbi:MAG: rhodanese-like domain-containing protein, partial [Brevinema sp.]
LDVRTTEEYKDAHLKHAHHIPVDELITLNNIPYPKDQVIICYCRSGVRSQTAAEYISQLGYKVYNLGGYLQFSNDFIAKIQNK